MKLAQQAAFRTEMAKDGLTFMSKPYDAAVISPSFDYSLTLFERITHYILEMANWGNHQITYATTLWGSQSQVLVDYFSVEGFEIEIQGSLLTIDWSNWVREPCKQCNQLHRNTNCKEDE
jgi:hypothetical protein